MGWGSDNVAAIDQAFGEGAAEALRGEVAETGLYSARRKSVTAKTQKILVQFCDSDVEE